MKVFYEVQSRTKRSAALHYAPTFVMWWSISCICNHPNAGAAWYILHAIRWISAAICISVPINPGPTYLLQLQPARSGASSYHAAIWVFLHTSLQSQHSSPSRPRAATHYLHVTTWPHVSSLQQQSPGCPLEFLNFDNFDIDTDFLHIHWNQDASQQNFHQHNVWVESKDPLNSLSVKIF